ncbi:cell wall anchor [Dictyobacter aurantiacus]|uniref:Cell wall anchor n=2 Tax=Dictyobacter aurantiacus TaxID=1936993 RepID=A0A401ZFL3_9CHLR|nr:cell wall anchor [Dictyobacter aurantiacus]
MNKPGLLRKSVWWRLSMAMGLCAVLCVTGMLSSRPVMAAAAPAYVRIIHASPDIGIVDVFVDGKKILSDFQFATVTDYVPIASGAHKVQLALIGKGIDASIITQEMTVQAGTPYTIAALGTKESGFLFKSFVDNNVIAGTGAKVRVYHLSPGVGTASVSSQSNTLVNQISYANASSYIPVTSGTYAVTLNASAPKAALSTRLTLKPWSVLSVFAVGLVQGDPHWRLVSAQQQGIPGMPQTGGNPYVVSETYPYYWQWGIMVVALVGLLIGCVYAFTHKRASNSAAEKRTVAGG